MKKKMKMTRAKRGNGLGWWLGAIGLLVVGVVLMWKSSLYRGVTPEPIGINEIAQVQRYASTAWPPVSPKPKPPCSTDPSVCPPSDDGRRTCDTTTAGGVTNYCPHLVKPVSCFGELYSVPKEVSLDNPDWESLFKYKLGVTGMPRLTTSQGERFILRVVLQNVGNKPVTGDFYALFSRHAVDEPYTVLSSNPLLCSEPGSSSGAVQAIGCRQLGVMVPEKGQMEKPGVTPKVYVDKVAKTELYQVVEIGDLRSWRGRVVSDWSTGKARYLDDFPISIQGYFDGVSLSCGSVYFTRSEQGPRGQGLRERCYGPTSFNKQRSGDFPESWCRPL